MSKKLFNSITLAFIPHKGGRPVKMRISFLGIIMIVAFSLIAILSTILLVVKAPSYFSLKKQIYQARKQISVLKTNYDRDIGCLKDTLIKLQKTEKQLRKLLNLGSKEKIIEAVGSEDIPFSGIGSVDIEVIKREMERRISSLVELKSHLKKQKSIYLSIPRGWPVRGYISSGFGWRIHPITGKREFHYGIDIAAPLGTPVKATANGMVICTGRTRISGNYIVIQHGYGFTTVYAHLKKYIVKIGQKVKKGEVIGYIGSTGFSTGPHLFYGISKNKRWVNPLVYIKNKRKNKG